MALSGNFSLRDVRNEYGMMTRPDTERLSVFHNDILGHGGTGALLSDFDGYGRPVISNLSGSTSTQDGGFIDVSYTVNVGKLDTEITIEIQKDDGTIGSNDWSSVSAPKTYTVNGSDTVTLNVDPNTTYRVRLKYYNAFTRIDTIYHPDELGIGGVHSSGEAQDTLKLSELTLIYTNGVSEWRHWWKYPATSGNFIVEYTDDQDVTWKNATAQDLTYEGNDVWWAKFNPEELSSSGDLVQFRIRRSSTTEPWSYTQEFQSGQEITSSLSQPSISTLSTTNVGETSARVRMDVHSFDNIAGQEYNYWWQYRISGTSSWTSSAQSSVNSTGIKSRTISGLSGGTTYEYRAVARNTLGGTIQYGGVLSFTTEEVVLSPDPTNVQLIENGGSSEMTWNTPEAGNPSSYTLQVIINGTLFNVVTGLSGASTSYTFDICQYGNNDDIAQARVIAVYNNEPNGQADSPSTTITSCGGGGFGGS